MDLVCQQRPSDSPFVETIWTNRTEQAGPFISMALSHWEMVVTRCKGQTQMTIRGPETRATPAYCPPDAEFFGIIFKLGVYLSPFPTGQLVDHAENLPAAGSQSFWLDSSAWAFPTYENADTFVHTLVRRGLLVHDLLVKATLHGDANTLSRRSAQRHFMRATGLSHTTLRQIERARLATRMLKEGASILDTVFNAGYFDQPHLTRALKHYIGQTPAQIMDASREERLSLLYNTSPLIERQPCDTNAAVVSVQDSIRGLDYAVNSL